MSDRMEAETPISDHVRRFWQLLETEHVRITVDLRREIGHDAPDGPTIYWDCSTFNDVTAKAIVASRDVGLSNTPRHFEILVEAMSEVKAVADGQSDQPLGDIVKGCLEEIAQLSKTPSSSPQSVNASGVSSDPTLSAEGIREALEQLVSACEQVFCSDATEKPTAELEPCSDDDAVMAGEDGDDRRLTFGMIRRARAALSALPVQSGKMVQPSIATRPATSGTAASDTELGGEG